MIEIAANLFVKTNTRGRFAMWPRASAGSQQIAYDAEFQLVLVPISPVWWECVVDEVNMSEHDCCGRWVVNLPNGLKPQ